MSFMSLGMMYMTAPGRFSPYRTSGVEYEGGIKKAQVSRQETPVSPQETPDAPERKQFAFLGEEKKM
jgi:hypothetical protein